MWHFGSTYAGRPVSSLPAAVIVRNDGRPSVPKPDFRQVVHLLQRYEQQFNQQLMGSPDLACLHKGAGAASAVERDALG